MNEMAKARGFHPVTNKLEYMQAPAWVSRDGGGPKGKGKGKGGGKPRSFGQEGCGATMEERNWEVEHWSKQ